MSEVSPPRGGVVEPQPHHVDPFDFLKSGKDRLEWFNRAVRPTLTVALGLALTLMAIMVGTALGLAAWRAALALPVGDMTVGLGPLAATLVPVLLHQVTRSMDKRAGVAG